MNDMRNPKNIVRMIAKRSGVSIRDMLGESKRRSVVYARRDAVALIYSETNMSMDEIGEMFGGRNRSTIHYILTSKNGRDRR